MKETTTVIFINYLHNILHNILPKVNTEHQQQVMLLT